MLFLLGANDHVLPQPPSGHGLLEPEEREALQQRDILLSDAAFDPLDNELQNIYACLAQPVGASDGELSGDGSQRRTAAALLCGASGWSGCFRA